MQEQAGGRSTAEHVANNILPNISPATCEFLEELMVVGSVGPNGRVV